jgi:predicted ferric reductase
LKFVPSNIAQAAEYILPSIHWSVNFGIIALTGMLILIYITLYTKMKYHKWKFTHEFLGLMFFFAVLHIFLVRGNASADNIFDGYYIYAAIVSLIGLGAFSYSLFIKNRLVKNAVYKIKNIEQSKDMFEIDLVPEHKPINYKSGQFIYIRFYNEKLSKEPHPFSIASKSGENTIKIVVKKLGDFTNYLENLKVGEKVSIEGPYGRFNFRKYRDKDQIWIAAGIGITPFLGMAEDLLNIEKHGKIELYYTVRNEPEFIGYDKFSKIASNIEGFSFVPWISNKNGRINVNVIKKFSGNLRDKEVFICGPERFKESLIKQIVNEGTKKSSIHEEAFEFR